MIRTRWARGVRVGEWSTPNLSRSTWPGFGSISGHIQYVFRFFWWALVIEIRQPRRAQ